MEQSVVEENIEEESADENHEKEESGGSRKEVEFEVISKEASLEDDKIENSLKVKYNEDDVGEIIKDNDQSEGSEEVEGE